jgi:hypothetical protein
MSADEFEGLPGAAVSLLKGGVGKSTIALNIADRLAARGHETVLLDLDKDGHMTTQLGYDDAYNRDANLGDALINGEDTEDLLIEMDFGVHLLPSSNELENVETRMFSPHRSRPTVQDRFSGVSPNPLALQSIIRNTSISLPMEVVEGWGRFSFVRSATRLLLGISITLKRWFANDIPTSKPVNSGMSLPKRSKRSTQ